MVCQFCEIEYPRGTERCAECGCDLVAELPPDSGQLVLETLVELHAPRELELLIRLFEAAGLPYLVHAGTALPMSEAQSLVDTARPNQWEARIMVVSSRFAEAKEMLARVTRDAKEESAHRARFA